MRRWFYRNIYLQTDHWRKIAKMVKRRDGHQCQVKGCNQKILDTHHTTYQWHGIPILFLEKLFLHLLITLCRSHHTETHKGVELKLRSGKTLKGFRTP